MSNKVTIQDQDSDYDLEFERYLDEINLYEYNINTTYESLILKAIKKKALIEFCSLLYNAIELIIIQKIHNNYRDKFRSEYLTKLKLHKLKKSIPMDQEIKFRKMADKEIKDIWNKKTKTHLLEYANIAKKQKLISKIQFKQISKFNTDRNIIIHKLLIPNTKMTYWNLIATAKLGRKIQLEIDGQYTQQQINAQLIKIENIKPQPYNLDE